MPPAGGERSGKPKAARKGGFWRVGFSGRMADMPETTSSSRLIRTTGIVIILALVLLGGWYYFKGDSGYTYELAPSDSIQQWNFQGAYTGNSELEQKARDEIARIETLIGIEGDEHTDYTVYMGIAAQYDLLGDGRSEYEHLNKALSIDSETTGLAWHNMGALMDRLGAKQTAREAYRRAAAAQSQQIQYWSSYAEYLTRNFSQDTAAIETAFNDAAAIFGDNATLLDIRARWLESVNRPQEAVEAWKKVKALSPASAAAVDLEIRRLEGSL